jgi:hypothetical protein
MLMTTFVARPHSPEQLQDFLSHINDLRPAILFTMEMESGSPFPSLEVLVIQRSMTLDTKIYRKPTDTD